jgi:hypothetical protein
MWRETTSLAEGVVDIPRSMSEVSPIAPSVETILGALEGTLPA